MGEGAAVGLSSTATLSDAATIHRDLIRIGRAIRARSGGGTLSAGQMSALWTIAQNAPIRATEVAEREGVAAPTMSRVVASLERHGMVMRTTDPRDGRVSLLTPTADGVDHIRGASSRNSELFEMALDQLADDERMAVERSMRLLADTMCGLTAPTTDSPDTADSATVGGGS
ncbi:MarR family transcriptional regulator [Gordonia sp. SID5947]|uniref:MarR family winged helix-turn-helix transcriptional regulator n=1 Tax=Gordonia sp. SID5947 TaxID=2690315 RepID=UPI001369E2FD|nr:MarR family transcriptional regulator [Gordonia sp. SID5947]MYR08161.1 MarR family transcriptional regulator [Gordonia sp. SID5947]